ncbi:hypothetical protein BDQ12DRAFT_621534, partial [Crucibulum laeve]
MTAPNDEQRDELLLSCRYGDLEDVQQFVKDFGEQCLADVRDDNENCILHMICGNGHIDTLEYLLPIIPPSLLSSQNQSGSTPLHWAAVNTHLNVAKKLVGFKDGPGVDLIDIKNTAGHSPLAEAELAGWDEGAKWMVEVMNLGPEKLGDTPGGDAEEDVDAAEVLERDIEVEIEDADGQVAKMTISGASS